MQLRHTERERETETLNLNKAGTWTGSTGPRIATGNTPQTMNTGSKTAVSCYTGRATLHKDIKRQEKIMREHKDQKREGRRPKSGITVAFGIKW